MGKDSRKRRAGRKATLNEATSTASPGRAPLSATPRPQGAITPPRADFIRQVEQFFSRDDLAPGCYDHPDFLTLERSDPKVLERYAFHVLTEGAKRNAGKEHVIETVAKRFSAALAGMSPDESYGQCVSVSGKLIRALEMLGIWCIGAKGSVSVYTSDGCNPDGWHFFAIDDVDHVDGTPGHLWVVAPPFTVVDCSIYYQGWEPGLKAVMDSLVLTMTSAPETPDFQRFAAPAYRRDPRAHATFAGLQRSLWPWFSCLLVELKGVRLHYLPCGIMAPEQAASQLTFIGRPLASFVDGLDGSSGFRVA